jgi:hypothetical protein
MDCMVITRMQSKLIRVYLSKLMEIFKIVISQILFINERLLLQMENA